MASRTRACSVISSHASVRLRLVPHSSRGYALALQQSLLPACRSSGVCAWATLTDLAESARHRLPRPRGGRRDDVGGARHLLFGSAGRAAAARTGRGLRPGHARGVPVPARSPPDAGRLRRRVRRSCCSGGPRSSLPTSATGRPTSRCCPMPPAMAIWSPCTTSGTSTIARDQDFVPRYDERTFDLRELDAVDLIAVYWMGDAIAHIMVSFGFAGDHVAISIETRKEKGEAYSSIAGFFKRYELIYVVGDERDLIRVRTNYRRPQEQVYLYRTRARPRQRASSVPGVCRQDQPAEGAAGVLQHAHHQLHDRRLVAGARAFDDPGPARLAGAAERLFSRVRLRSRQPRYPPAVCGAEGAKPDQRQGARRRRRSGILQPHPRRLAAAAATRRGDARIPASSAFRIMLGCSLRQALSPSREGR